jgi:hypothetical protein
MVMPNEVQPSSQSMRGYWRSVAQHADTIPVAARPRQQLSSICLLKKCEPGPRLEVGRSPRLAHEHNRQSLLSFPTFPFPGANCARPNEAPRGLGGGNPGAQIGPIRSTALVGAGRPGGNRPPLRAPSFLAARHPPLCPRLRRGVLTARISFSGACSLGRLRRCIPMRSAVFLTGCTISTPPATGVRSQDATRASGSTLAPTCARKWKIANGASTTRGSARQDRRCSQEDRFQSLPDAPTRW